MGEVILPKRHAIRLMRFKIAERVDVDKRTGNTSIKSNSLRTLTKKMNKMPLSRQKLQLSDFLKKCRARTMPADAGIPLAGRRRTPGLRREDVATLSGISVTWYTWLEQGRDVRASNHVLERLSQVFHLSTEERDYLYSLAQNHPAPILPAFHSEISHQVQLTLDLLNLPALIMNLRWDVLYWNPMMAAAIRDYSLIPREERNLIKILLTSPERRAHAEDYEMVARRILAKLRMDYVQSGESSSFDVLIDEINEICPNFEDLWRSPEITGHSDGIHTEHHPTMGEITFIHSSYVVEGNPNQRVVIYAPHDNESATKLAELQQSYKQQPDCN